MFFNRLMSIGPNERFQAASDYMGKGMTSGKIITILVIAAVIIIFVVAGYLYSKKK